MTLWRWVGCRTQIYVRGRNWSCESFINPAERKLSGTSKQPEEKQNENNWVRAEGRGCYQDSNALYQKLCAGLPGFSFIKDACNPSILIPIFQPTKVNNTSGRKCKEILSIQERQNTKILQIHRQLTFYAHSALLRRWELCREKTRLPSKTETKILNTKNKLNL